MDENGRELKEKDPLRSEILADDASGDHEKRLSRYSVAMARKQEVVDHILVLKEQGYKFNLDKELKALQDCGSFLIYRHYYLIDRFRLLAGCTCKKHLLCPLCAIRRAAKCVAVGFQKIEDVLQRGYETGVEYDQVLITLTIKNGDDLEERFLHLTNSFKMLLQKRRNALKKRPKTDTVFKHVLGSIYSYEVTYSEEKGYHPHVHMIALIPRGTFEFQERFDKKAKKAVQVPVDLWAGLVEDWKSITGDSFIVDVRRIDNENDQLSALVECFKYALKFSDMEVADQVECYTVLKGRRMLDSMGALRGIKFPDNLHDDLIPGEEKYVDIVYRYAGVTFGYQEISRGGASLPEDFVSKVQKGIVFKETSRKAPDGSLWLVERLPNGKRRLVQKNLPEAPF